VHGSGRNLVEAALCLDLPARLGHRDDVRIVPRSPRWTRALIIAGAGLIVALFSTRASDASTCAPPPLPVQVSRAAVIFEGRAERVVYLGPDGAPENPPRQSDSLCGRKLVSFRVTKVLKGTAGETVTAFADDGCLRLGGYYRAGEEFVVFAFTSYEALWGPNTSRPDLGPGGRVQWAGMVLHTCGGTRGVRNADGSVISGSNGPSYMAEIAALVKGLPAAR
jgi:hypothetical protein